ncbi:MAG: helix-turn-helix domain-containing protein [Pyrinomonadaceae bacterium]
MKTIVGDDLWQDFGAWLRSKREELNLSQSGAANRAGIDRQQWYRLENGLSGTRRDTVIAIAKALSLDPEEALDRSGFGTGTLTGTKFIIGDHASVKLSDQDLSPEDQEEIAEELALAYELIMARRAAKRKKNDG